MYTGNWLLCPTCELTRLAPAFWWPLMRLWPSPWLRTTARSWWLHANSGTASSCSLSIWPSTLWDRNKVRIKKLKKFLLRIHVTLPDERVLWCVMRLMVMLWLALQFSDLSVPDQTRMVNATTDVVVWNKMSCFRNKKARKKTGRSPYQWLRSIELAFDAADVALSRYVCSWTWGAWVRNYLRPLPERLWTSGTWWRRCTSSFSSVSTTSAFCDSVCEAPEWLPYLEGCGSVPARKKKNSYPHGPWHSKLFLDDNLSIYHDLPRKSSFKKGFGFLKKVFQVLIVLNASL